jgi:uncharacterized protein YggE
MQSLTLKLKLFRPHLLQLVALLSLPATGLAGADSTGITATGTCLKKIAQDRAAVTLSVSTLAANPSLASSEATKSHQKLREAIQSLKLPNLALETSNYSVSEEREWVNKKMISKGFRARISLVVETSEIGRMGEVISTATTLGLKEINGLTTFVSNERHKAEYEGCLEVASRNAKDKAAKLAKGAGIKLGKVKSIQEGVVQNPPSIGRAPVMMTRAFADSETAEGGAGPTVDAKSVDMTVNSTVTFDTD